MKWVAAGMILLATATGAESCSGTPSLDNQTCGDGKGHWIEDESDTLSKGYTVVVRICVDDGGNVIDMEVD